MENPDVEWEVTRDVAGNITGGAYKVNRADEDRKNMLEFFALMSEVCQSERPVDVEVNVSADVNLGG